jgi:hypothetical protein
MHLSINGRARTNRSQRQSSAAPLDPRPTAALGSPCAALLANRATSPGTYPPIRGHVRGELDGDVLVSGPGFCTWNPASGYKHSHKLLIFPSSLSARSRQKFVRWKYGCICHSNGRACMQSDTDTIKEGCSHLAAPKPQLPMSWNCPSKLP